MFAWVDSCGCGRESTTASDEAAKLPPRFGMSTREVDTALLNSGDTPPCKVTPVILHGVVSPGVRRTCAPISPYSGRDCVKSLRSSYTGLYPQVNVNSES